MSFYSRSRCSRRCAFLGFLDFLDIFAGYVSTVLDTKKRDGVLTVSTCYL